MTEDRRNFLLKRVFEEEIAAPSWAWRNPARKIAEVQPPQAATQVLANEKKRRKAK